MIRERVIPITWLLAACVLIGAAVGAQAKAEPADPARDFAIQHAAKVCDYLDHHPTTTGVGQVLQLVADAGLNAYDAGTTVALSVINVCPAHRKLLSAYVNQAQHGGRAA